MTWNACGFFYVLSLSLSGVTKENQENVLGQLVSMLTVETLVPCARSASSKQDIAAMDAGPIHVGQHEFFLSLILSLSPHNNICKGGKCSCLHLECHQHLQNCTLQRRVCGYNVE